MKLPQIIELTRVVVNQAPRGRGNVVRAMRTFHKGMRFERRPDDNTFWLGGADMTEHLPKDTDDWFKVDETLVAVALEETGTDAVDVLTQRLSRQELLDVIEHMSGHTLCT